MDAIHIRGVQKYAPNKADAMRMYERIEEIEDRLDSIESRLDHIEDDLHITADDLEDAAEQGAKEVGEITESRIKKLERDIQEIRFELGKDYHNRPKYSTKGAKSQ